MDEVVVQGHDGDRVYTLQGAERPYRVLVQEMHEGAVIISREGFVLYANSQFANLAAATLDEVTGTPFFSFLDQPYWAMTRAALSHGAEHPIRFEADLKCNGNTVPVQVSLKPLELEETYICAVVSDLTERKKSDELARSEALARAILDQVTEAVVVTDLAGRVTRASGAAIRLTGSHVLFETVREAFRLTKAAGTEQPDASRNDSIPAPGLYRAAGVGNSHLELLVRSGQLLDNRGTPIGYIVTLADVTALQKTKEELEDAVARLGLANDDLQQFAYAASHDLQEPIRTVVAFTQMMGQRYQGRLDAEFDTMLKHVVQSGQRLNALLKDLLNYITAGQPAPHDTVNTDSRAAAQMALANLGPVLRQAGAAVEISDELPHVDCPFTQLMQIFQNLVSNSVKYRSDSPLTVRITAEQKDRWWEFCVRDNGIGISPQYHHRIFGVFRRTFRARASDCPSARRSWNSTEDAFGWSRR